MAQMLSHGDRLTGNISKEFSRFGGAFVALSDIVANSSEIDGRLYLLCGDLHCQLSNRGCAPQCIDQNHWHTVSDHCRFVLPHPAWRIALTQIGADKWAAQPKLDLFPLFEKVKEYAGILPQLNACIETAKEATQRVQEMELAVCALNLVVRKYVHLVVINRKKLPRRALMTSIL